MLNLICLAILTRPVTVKTETYEAWPGCVRISNGIVDLVVVPQIGRIMRFGFVGKRNLLFEAERTNGLPPKTGLWKNWGGDKLWPAPQSTWGWPPEPEYDGAEWTVENTPTGIHMFSKNKSAKLGLRFERTISLVKGSPEARVKDTLVNDSGKTASFAVWEVCQVDDPETCILPIPNAKGWHIYGENKVDDEVYIQGRELLIKRDLTRPLKYGSSSPDEYVSALFKGYALTLRTTLHQGLPYPDQGTPEQVYTNPDPVKYAELELTGPLTTLLPGGSTSITVSISARQTG